MQSSTCVDARSLEYFPIQLFATIMGLSGFAIVFAKAHYILGFSYWFYLSILFVDTLLFLLIFSSYMLKIASYPEAVKKEIKHPIKSSFMASISVSLLLLSIAYYDFVPTLSIFLWFVAAPLQLFFTLVVINYWIHNDLEVVHSNPAWFIPIVGNALVPIIGVEVAPIFISLFFFSLGMFFWIVLFTIMMNRLIFHKPLAKKLIPTFFIFIAPPAVGFVSYLKITNGSIDLFSIFLYSIALFTLLLLLFMLRIYDIKLFFISWWAYTFPLAAITIATLLMHKIYDSALTYLLSLSLITFLTLVVGFVALKTIQAIMAKKICILEE